MKSSCLALLFTAFCVIYAGGRGDASAQDVSTTPPVGSGSNENPVSTTPPVSSASEVPVTITADGTNTYTGNMATANDNAVVRYKDEVIYADHITYDRSTKVVTADGNVRIFSKQKIYRGDSITYNLETKAMTSSSFFGAEYPRFVSGKKVTTPDYNHYRLTDASFTTNNREHPSFHLQAGTLEYRPNDEVVMKNVFFYIGDIPVLYFPILVQSLTDSRPVYQFEIGDSGRYGYFMDNKYNWVASDKMRGTVELDAREKRGYAGGVDVQYFPTLNSDILLKTYYAQDNLYSQNDPNVPNAPNRGYLADSNTYDGVPSDSRYRIAYEHHLQFGPDFSSIADLNLWSDPFITRDFFSSEYQEANQPPNFIQLNQYNPNFTVSLLASPQVNPFFETVERLPEFMIESKQQKIFGSPIEYSSTSSVVNFERKFADLQNFSDPSAYPFHSFPTTTAYDYYHPNSQNYAYNTAEQNNYSAFRYDTYHEFSYPHQYFNFLSISPHIGGRFTYYSDDNRDTNDTVNNDGLSSDKVKNTQARLAGNVGVDSSFRLSRTWLNLKDPNLGIDGIRHTLEPYVQAQYAPEPTVTPNQIRGFDTRLFNTQLQPLNWNDYNSVDSIDKQAVVRSGIRNKIQTKRDGINYDLVDWDTYTDADFDHNFTASTPSSTFSNLFNKITFNPISQLQFSSFSSIDVSGGGYNEIDNDATWSPDPSLRFTLGDHYINHSPIFQSDNSVAVDLFYRINEHWQVETQHQFEGQNGHLQLQSYTVYRDLDSWQLALTYSDSEVNNGHSDQAIFFSLTLKAFPQYELHTPRL